MKSHVFGFALLSAIGIVTSAPVQAQNGSLTRSFVSSAGLDTNACTIAAPCATFAQAYTKIGANGIIAALDPGKYGPLTITGPVTINGNGWAAITGPSGGTAITINAVSGNVTLTGLEIDGAGVAYNGIVFNTGSSLTITNCSLLNFSLVGAIGIEVGGSPLTQSILIKNTMVLHSYTGILLATLEAGATLTAALQEVTINNNEQAVAVNASGAPVEALISNSHIDNNTNAGLSVSGSSTIGNVVLKNVTLNQTPGPIVMLGNSTLWISQVTEAIASGFPSNGGIIVQNDNNAVFSDGTSHIGSSALTIQTWAFQ
jgi:hypothetical protein